MNADEWATFLARFIHMATTHCVICGERTMYCVLNLSGFTATKPRTCGRLACLEKTSEAQLA